MKTIGRPIFIIFSFICAGFLSQLRAVSPPPDGGYPGGNTAEGTNALFNLSTGVWNTALGAQALYQDTTGGSNTGTGFQALFSNTIGGQNTASGAFSLFSNLEGQSNTATGYQSLFSNTIGGQNTASGAFSLFSNLHGLGNTADGYKALVWNTSGSSNTAVGAEALWRSTIGDNNTAIGAGALTYNTTAGVNTGIGSNALEHNTTGNGNTATGYAACDRNSTGGENTANGHLALYLNASGSNNLALGASAGMHVITADNVICIGSNVAGDDVSNSTWLGNIYGVTTQNGTTAPVVVSADGQLGTVASSERFKKDIATMDKASEAIMSLRPVTFHYKTDSKGTRQFGLIAEEVARVNPALVLPDKEGKPYTVRYDAVNAMLLNEFLKEHRKVEEQQATIAELKNELEANAARQQKQIEALTAGLQKVSAQLKVSKPTPRMVLNND
jgi:Chaperone of endosialidase